MQDERPVCALTIAGSDSGGGAGIQADLKTFAAHGVHGLSAIAALTAQHTRGVTAVHVPDLGFLRAQLDACFDDFRIGAVKIGMLANAAANSQAGPRRWPERTATICNCQAASHRKIAPQPLLHCSSQPPAHQPENAQVAGHSNG